MHQKKQFDFEKIVKLVYAPLKSGDVWYLLDKKWYDLCKVYHETGDKSNYPGPIDNSALFEPISTNNSKSSNGLPSSTANENTEPKTCSADAISIDSKPLRSDLNEAEGHFIVIPEECWNLLKESFGLVSSSHIIKRRAIDIAPGQTIVEIHPVTLRLCLYGGTEPTVEKRFSRITSLNELQLEMRKVFDISADREVKLWINSAVYTFEPSEISPSKSENCLQTSTSTNKPIPPPPQMPNSSNSVSTPTVITRQSAHSMNKLYAVPDTTTSPNSKSSTVSSSTNSSPVTSTGSKDNYAANQTLIDVGVSNTAVATLELINPDGTWPSSRPRYGTVSTRSSKAQPGLCGLSNMGNTCFMNAALQCLSNTPPLTNYILTDKFVEDINTSNPLGMHGEIARTYSELIKVLWGGNNSSFLPREFKCAVSRFAPQFCGFSQQDCQELMAFLLDGLHEDLNRIRNKPYIEIKNDFETRPDEVVAEESWSNYKKRNDSIVVDTFHALLKSTLVCPGCELVSVTFDPFCYLSLPLPVKREKQVNPVFIPAPGKVEEESPNPTQSSVDSTVDTSVPKVTPRPTLQLKDCITQFTNIERLGADDPWYCPKCKKHQQATKKFDIWSLPKVLIIHLKRFSFSRSWRDKIDTLVEFPVDGLDMSKYVLNPEQKKTKQIYNLIGVANHFGGLGGGHYTAYAKNFLQNAWYSFDDAMVNPVSSNNIVNRSAYVLFYQLQEDESS